MGKKRPGRPDELNRRLCEVIDERRRNAGMSMNSLAAAASINRGTLQRLFDGRTTWDVAYMQMIATALGCSIRDLLDAADPTGELTDFTEPDSAALASIHDLPLPEHSTYPSEPVELDEVADHSPDEDALRDERGEW